MDKINNNVNFTARMDVSRVLGKQSERWKKISEIFADKTFESPMETFYLEGFTEDKLELRTLNRANSRTHGGKFCKELVEYIHELSDEAIAEKFSLLHKFFKQKDYLYDETSKYLREIGSTMSPAEYFKTESLLWNTTKEIAQNKLLRRAHFDEVLANIDELA